MSEMQPSDETAKVQFIAAQHFGLQSHGHEEADGVCESLFGCRRRTSRQRHSRQD